MTTPPSSAIGSFVIGESPIGGPLPAGSSIPSLTAAQVAARLAATFPRGWASQDAKSSGNMSALFTALGGGLAFEITAEQYALAATRIQTAANGALDLASEDYFGDGLPRLGGETDAAFSARIMANLLPPGATRAAIQARLEVVTGGPVRMIEPWDPNDTGAWDSLTSFWDVDSAATPFRWTDGATDYQGFIECQLPVAQSNGNPYGWDGGASGGLFAYDGGTFGWLDMLEGGQSNEQTVLDALNVVRPYGTIEWIKFVNQILIATSPFSQGTAGEYSIQWTY